MSTTKELIDEACGGRPPTDCVVILMKMLSKAIEQRDAWIHQNYSGIVDPEKYMINKQLDKDNAELLNIARGQG